MIKQRTITIDRLDTILATTNPVLHKTITIENEVKEYTHEYFITVSPCGISYRLVFDNDDGVKISTLLATLDSYSSELNLVYK